MKTETSTPTAPGGIDSILAEHGVAASAVRHAMTAGVPATHEEATQRTMNAVAELVLCGVRFALNFFFTSKGA